MNILEHIHSRSFECGDCWEWQGALQSSGTTPVIRYKRRFVGVRRLFLELRGVKLDGKVATYSCGNPLCVNPDHLHAIDRKALQKRSAEAGYPSLPTRRKKISEKARARAKLTLDQAIQIREAQGNQYQIAARFGVTQGTVSDIKLGRTWKDYSSPFSNMVGGLTR